MKIFPRVFAFTLGIALASCSVHNTRTENYQITVPDSFSDGSPDRTGLSEGKWWERFNDGQLNILVEEAFRNNLDIVQAFERFNQAQAVFAATGAARAVQLGIQAEAGKVRQYD